MYKVHRIYLVIIEEANIHITFAVFKYMYTKICITDGEQRMLPERD